MRTLYRGGSVYAPSDPFATAMLVDGATIAWIGSDDAATSVASGADVVELDGALLAPAFVDAHVHITETGLALAGVDLTRARSVAAVLDAVAGAARAGGDVLGHGWDEASLAEGRPPSRSELDRAGGGARVYLARVDVHSAVVSSAVAEAAGLAGLDGWDDAGRVERDAHHAARALTRDLTESRREVAQRRALGAAAAAGIAVVHEMSAPHVAPQGDLAALVALAEDLGLPEVVPYHGSHAGSAEQARELAAATGVDLLGLAGDLCVDGSVGSRTAAYRDEYADAPGHRGHLYLDAEAVAVHVISCVRAGLQPGFHVIGDAAVDAVLAGLRAAAVEVGEGPLRTSRPRCEHLEALDTDAVAEVARLGVVASVQPAFDAAWGGTAGMYERRLGAERAARMNPLAELAAAGVPLSLGSDSPVTPFDPWGAVRAATFHRTTTQRISARAAFSAHTRGAHRAAGVDDRGVLRVGSEATFAVWVVGDLVVQAPDDRIRAWSTDVRSGTPGLPDVSPGVALPTCRRTLLRGVVLHDVG